MIFIQVNEASIYKLCSMEIRDICIFISMYVFFFYGTFTRASTNNLDSMMNSTFHVGGSSPD